MAARKQTTTMTIYGFCSLEVLQLLYFQYLLNSNNKTKPYNYQFVACEQVPEFSRAAKFSG